MTAVSAPSISRAARAFHALSDETRLRILARLRAGERCVCDLMAELHVAQSRLSFHLKTLKEAGLVVDRREGRWSYYAIAPDARDDLTTALEVLEPRMTGPRNRTCC
jgi:ArsR family transcriptional regulator